MQDINAIDERRPHTVSSNTKHVDQDLMLVPYKNSNTNTVLLNDTENEELDNTDTVLSNDIENWELDNTNAVLPHSSTDVELDITNEVRL